MKNKITKRDILFFFIGVIVMFLIVIAWEWNDVVKGFNDGYNDDHNTEKIN